MSSSPSQASCVVLGNWNSNTIQYTVHCFCALQVGGLAFCLNYMSILSINFDDDDNDNNPKKNLKIIKSHP
jgi:hypothetical protein